MNPLVYEAPGQAVPQVPEVNTEPIKTDTFSIDGFEFAKIKEDPKTNTAGLVSLINTMLVALASSTDPKIKEVLDKSGLQVSDANGKVYFPR